MTAFKKENFDMGSGSERWVIYNERFIARFKYRKPASCAKHFVKFLIANFTVEEFFKIKLLDKNATPIGILETKGYVSYNVCTLLKKEGLPQTQEGYQKFVEDRMKEE